MDIKGLAKHEAAYDLMLHNSANAAAAILRAEYDEVSIFNESQKKEFIYEYNQTFTAVEVMTRDRPKGKK